MSVELGVGKCLRIPHGAAVLVCLPPDSSTSGIQSCDPELEPSASFDGIGVGTDAFWEASLRFRSKELANKMLPSDDAKGPEKENKMKIILIGCG